MGQRYFKQGTTLDQSDWPEYRKRRTIRAIRIKGPFFVMGRHDDDRMQTIRDGYLTTDTGGFLVGMEKEQFEKLYERVTPESAAARALYEALYACVVWDEDIPWAECVVRGLDALAKARGEKPL